MTDFFLTGRVDQHRRNPESHDFAGLLSPSFGEHHQVAISVDAMASSLGSMMDQNLSMPDKCCIFKVPRILRRHNEKAYEPNCFSIGPWHHNNSNLKPTEKIKLKYLQGLLSRSPNEEERLKEFIAAVKDDAGQAASYYAGLTAEVISMENFIRLLVLDGCFIIELLRKYEDEKLRDEDDPIFSMSCLLQFLHHDLILLENQIPWFVLQRLFDMTEDAKDEGNESRSNTTLSQLVLKFFSNIFSFTPPPIDASYKEQKHILDLLRNWLLLDSGKLKDGKKGWEPIPSASYLQDAGIQFKKGESTSILDIKFNPGGVLEIPSLLIQETTEVVFRNLISYEQCTPNCPAIITSYAVLLDNLINTSEDMNILADTRSGVFDNWLNPEDATQFFNKLYHDAYLKDYYYLDLCKRVNEYCGNTGHRWRAYLVRNYFLKPWAIVSLIVAALLLVLAVLQTIFSIITK